MIAPYQRGVKKKRSATMSKCHPNGMLITPEMGGKIVLSILNKEKGDINRVRTEIAERGIEPPTLIEDMKWKEVTNLLRMEELKRLHS